jgi:hypothetical protein
MGMISILLLTCLTGFIPLLIPFKPYEFSIGLAIMACVPTSLSSGVSLVIGSYGNGALALLFTVASNLVGGAGPASAPPAFLPAFAWQGATLALGTRCARSRCAAPANRPAPAPGAQPLPAASCPASAGHLTGQARQLPGQARPGREGSSKPQQGAASAWQRVADSAAGGWGLLRRLAS